MLQRILFVACTAIAAVQADVSAGAAPGFIPYHAGVFGKSSNMLNPNQTAYTLLCSGAIIGSEAVLTTASCVTMDAEFYDLGFAVLAGFVDRFDDDLVYTDVAEVRKHEDYVEGDRTSDIAVLKLGTGLTLSENVKTIGIRESSAVGVGSACTLSGWRKDLLTLSPVLRYSNVTVLSTTECHAVVDAEICAGAAIEEDRVGCQLGDEGSPVSCEFVLTGIMHYNIDTCLPEPEPGVFGDVFAHAAWIKTQLAAESTTTPAPSTPTAGPTDQTSTPAPVLTSDHPTGEIDGGGAGTLSSSLIAVVLMAAVVAVVQ